MLETWFQSKGLSDPDQVLAYFAVSKLGEPPTDGKTDTNPEGLTAAYGKWASAVAGRLLAGGLSCKVTKLVLISIDCKWSLSKNELNPNSFQGKIRRLQV